MTVPDFSGTWKLDLKASRLPELLMDMQGMGWAERRVGRMISNTQIITQTETALDIQTQSPLGSRQETLRLDGHPQITTYKRIGEVTLSSCWDGPIQITQTLMNTPKGAVTVIGRRRLEPDRQTMVIELEVNTEDGRQQIVERVFRRIPADV